MTQARTYFPGKHNLRFSPTPRAPVVLWGATGQAKVLRELLVEHDVVAVFDRSDVAPPFPDVPLIVGEFEAWRSEHSGEYAFLVAIGGGRGRDRLERQAYLESQGLVPLTAVHPRAFVASNATLGAGSQVLAMAAVAAEARLGRAVIVNTGATVDHECVLGDGVHVGPGAHLAGLVAVGDCAFIGTGATILPRIRIGDDAVVGAGAVVTRDVPAGATVVGNPARVFSPNP